MWTQSQRKEKVKFRCSQFFCDLSKTSGFHFEGQNFPEKCNYPFNLSTFILEVDKTIDPGFSQPKFHWDLCTWCFLLASCPWRLAALRVRNIRHKVLEELKSS